MNNVVDYLEFKIQTRARGHIINSSSAPVITIVVILLPFSTQVVIDVNFVSTASGWEYDCTSHPRFLVWMKGDQNAQSL